jgi:hypothetical protein
MACTAVQFEFRILYGFLTREGTRSHEATALTWSDFDLKRGLVRLDKNKTDDPRSWALTSGVVEALRVLHDELRPGAKPTDHVFLRPEGMPMAEVKGGHLAEWLRKHLRVLGLHEGTTGALHQHRRAPSDSGPRPAGHVRDGRARQRQERVLGQRPDGASFQSDDRDLQAHRAHVRRAPGWGPATAPPGHPRTFVWPSNGHGIAGRLWNSNHSEKLCRAGEGIRKRGGGKGGGIIGELCGLGTESEAIRDSGTHSDDAATVPSDPVVAAISAALEAAVKAGQFDVVKALAAQLVMLRTSSATPY